MKLLLPFLALFCWGTILTAQHTIKTDLVLPAYSIADQTHGLRVAYERRLSNRTALEVGLHYERIEHARVQTVALPPFQDAANFERSVWGIGITPGYRFYFQANSAPSETHRGLFLAAYVRLIASKMVRQNYLTDFRASENGISVGLGGALGYRQRFGRFSLEGVLGFGKGTTTHDDLFELGIFDLQILSVDVLFHRLEVNLGFDF